MRLVTLSKVIRAVLCLSAVSVMVGFLNNLHVNRPSSSPDQEESPHTLAVNQKLMMGAVPPLVNHKQVKLYDRGTKEIFFISCTFSAHCTHLVGLFLSFHGDLP